MRFSCMLCAFALLILGGCHRAAQSASAQPLTSAAPAASTPSPATSRTQPPKLAIVTNNASMFWHFAYRGAQEYSAKADIRIDWRMPPNGRVEDQNQILEELLASGYDGIAVSVINAEKQTPMLQRLAAQTRLITFDSDAPNTGRLLYIGTDNYAAGKKLGGEIVRLLPAGGKVAVFCGRFANDNAAQRLRGILAAVEGHAIQIVERCEDQTDRAKARVLAQDMLNAHPEVNLLCGLWSYNGPAIAEALRASGKNGKVLAVCFDEEQATLAAVADGTISVTIVQQPYEFGYLAAKWLHRLTTDFNNTRREIPANGFIDAGTVIINKSNLDEFRRRLAEMQR
jgi:ribose transport system substrate-binding protein